MCETSNAMPITIPCYWIVTSLLTLVAVGGCASHVAPPAQVLAERVEIVPAPEEPAAIPVIRHGRYTLVELEPTAAQRDLLMQVVEVVLPQGIEATVGDGLRHVLKRSGLRLCEGMPAIAELDALPLPAAHLSLGPMTLRDALVTLVGAAWELRLDERARQVCFVASGDMPDDAPDIEGRVDTVQTFPLTGEQP